MYPIEHVIVCTNNHLYNRSDEHVFNRKIIYVNGYLFSQESNHDRNYMERIKIEDIMEEILQAE